MATVKKFEDLEAWQNAKNLVGEAYRITSSVSFSKDMSFRDQIRRASISVMANVSEGFERDGDKEFLHFLAMAKGSCGELRSHLYAALDMNYISQGDFERLYEKSIKTSQIIAGLIRYLKDSGLKGKKFK